MSKINKDRESVMADAVEMGVNPANLQQLRKNFEQYENSPEYKATELAAQENAKETISKEMKNRNCEAEDTRRIDP